MNESGAVTAVADERAVITATNGTLKAAVTVYVGRVIVTLDEDHFPDETFRTAVASAFDKDADGRLTVDEIGKAVELHATGKATAFAQGLEYLTSLTSLDLSGNALTSVSVGGGRR